MLLASPVIAVTGERLNGEASQCSDEMVTMEVARRSLKVDEEQILLPGLRVSSSAVVPHMHGRHRCVGQSTLTVFWTMLELCTAVLLQCRCLIRSTYSGL